LKRQAVADGQANVKLEFDFIKQVTKSKTRMTKRKTSDNEGTSKAPRKKPRGSNINVDDMYESDPSFRAAEVADDEDGTGGESFDWSFSMRDELPSHSTQQKQKSNVQKFDDDVIVLSDSDHEIV
jgi:hypothetical protein